MTSSLIGRRRLWAGAIAAATVVAFFGLAASDVSAAMSADQVKQKVEAEFGVRVLKVRPLKEDGRSAFAVTVMNPGGDFDEAFQVNTIVVDAESGRPIPQFRHRSSGISDAGHSRRETNAPLMGPAR